MSKIIVTDDDGMNLRMAEMILTRGGHEVIKAASGEECVQAVKEQGAELLLLDVLMPGMDGFETFEAVRALPEGADLPVVFLTASDEQEVLDKAVAMGAHSCLGKPFRQDTLLARVQEAIG